MATAFLSATLGEGNTPLVPSVRIGQQYGLRNLWFKLESCNPSGSYKDRFVAGEVPREEIARAPVDQDAAQVEEKGIDRLHSLVSHCRVSIR